MQTTESNIKEKKQDQIVKLEQSEKRIKELQVSDHLFLEYISNCKYIYLPLSEKCGEGKCAREFFSKVKSAFRKFLKMGVAKFYFSFFFNKKTDSCWEKAKIFKKSKGAHLSSLRERHISDLYLIL